MVTHVHTHTLEFIFPHKQTGRISMMEKKHGHDVYVSCLSHPAVGGKVLLLTPFMPWSVDDKWLINPDYLYQPNEGLKNMSGL